MEAVILSKDLDLILNTSMGGSQLFVTLVPGDSAKSLRILGR